MTAPAPSSDDGSDLPLATEHDPRPVVALPSRGLPTSAIVAIVLILGLLLFIALNGRRTAALEPTTSTEQAVLPVSTALPPLVVPPLYEEPAIVPAPPVLPSRDVPLPAFVPQPRPAPVIVAPTYLPQAPAALATPPPASPRIASGPALVIDNSVGQAPESTGSATPRSDSVTSTLSTDRARAGTLANRTMTVPQGTLIPAVLETGFDSTRAGFARALVQRNVRGFDGSRILIPRGSRLIGEYSADIQAGQRRATVIWSRLIRPDGATIELGSPAADPVGRVGVKASVNTHFLERFAGAILQSSLNVGVALAARSSSSPVIVALPGSLQGSTVPAPQSNSIRPTLRVAPGTSVSVFVARDLDFSGQETRE